VIILLLPEEVELSVLQGRLNLWKLAMAVAGF